MNKRNQIVASLLAGITLSTQALAQSGKVIDSPNCVPSEEYAAIVAQHTQLGELERDMGCNELATFNKQLNNEKRTLHRRTVDDGLSASDYAKELAVLEAKESAYREEKKDLQQRCLVPLKEKLALKREVDQRGRCRLEQGLKSAPD